MDPLSSAALGAAYGAASKVAPELYKDTLQPLAQEVGKFLGSAGELINATLGGGLDVASEKSRQFWINISNQVKKKRDSIPIENRVEPTLGFIYSAHQGLYSSIDSESLQTLFINLIGKAMDSKTASGALPIYSEIIKQITPDEAKLLCFMISNEGTYPIIDIRSKNKNPELGENLIIRNFSDISTKSKLQAPSNIQIYIDNLIRLNILTIPPGRHLVDQRYYEPIENSDYAQYLKKMIESSGHTCIFTRKYIQLTEFGRAFCDICDVQDVLDMTT